MQRTILPHSAGLFSNINKVVTWLATEPKTNFGILWPSGPEMIYGSPSDGNIWNHLFDPLGPTDSPPTARWPHMRYTGREAADAYLSHGWRKQMHAAWKKLRVRQDIADEADSFAAGFVGGDTVAVHIRNSYHGSQEAPGGLRPPLQAFSDAADGAQKVFLATDHVEAVEHFRSRFGSRLLVRDLDRVPDTSSPDGELHSHRPATVQDARDCLIDMLVMAQCSRLVSGVSNVATAVLYANPSAIHTFIRTTHPPAKCITTDASRGRRLQSPIRKQRN